METKITPEILNTEKAKLEGNSGSVTDHYTEVAKIANNCGQVFYCNSKIKGKQK